MNEMGSQFAAQKIVSARGGTLSGLRRSLLALGQLAMRNKSALRRWGVLGLVLLGGII